jgi:cobalamin biosynthesis protein CobW
MTEAANAYAAKKSSLEKTPVTIVTGFLGSGKTTLIRHLLQNPQGRRLAIIVNEFGDVGVDGDILKGCSDANCPEDAIIELTNGCICCTVADDFVPTIEALLARALPPEHIIIETSGLALPKPLLKAFDWPALKSRITVDGVIAVADAEAVADGRFAPNLEALEAQRQADTSIDHDTPLGEVFEDQVACADIVILNKSDLVDTARMAKARATVQAEMPRKIPMIEATEGRVDQRVLLGLGAAAEDDLAARPSHHEMHEEHDHDDFESFILTLPETTSQEAILARIEAVARDHGVLRAKGYVALAGKPMRLLVQGVGTRVRAQFDRPWKAGEKRLSQLVIIGEKGLDHAAITAAFNVTSAATSAA